MRHFLSLGAGVQSSTLYLMAVVGDVPRPELAIFADTRWEPAGVYTWLVELERIGGARVPIQRVTAGNIRTAALGGGRFASMPLYTESGDREGQLRRQCTREFKIEPVTKAIRQALGVERGARVPKGLTVTLAMGISLDEASRMKPNRLPWIHTTWPLIERRMNRADCLKWLAAHGYPEPPKSACIGCPFTNDARWREMKDNRPTEWADAVDFDAAIRHGTRDIKRAAFLHRSLLPLAEVDLSTAEERGQVNLFENECEGMCGV